MNMYRSSRILFAIAGVLVVTAGSSLFFLTEHTDQYFAWTVNPPLTAAFMGAAYLSAAVLQFGVARDSSWNRAGAVLPGILLFTTLTLVATLIHLDRFHLDSPIGWIWLAIYVLFPVFGTVVLLREERRPPSGGEVQHPAAPGVRLLAIVLATPLTVAGIILFLIPGDSAAFWPWELTPLTARAIGAWLIGMGATAAIEYLRNDASLSHLLGAGKAVLVALIVIGMARYPDNVEWNAISAWVLITILMMLALSSAISLFRPQIPQTQLPPSTPGSAAR